MRREILLGVVVAVLATAATYFVTRSLDSTTESIDRGAAALAEDQIRNVLREELTTDDGRTYGEVLTDINNRTIKLETAVEIMTRE